MKKLIILAALLAAALPSQAREIRSTITDSVQLSVDGPAIQSTRTGSSYSVSGSNISVGTLGGLNCCPSGSAPTISAGSYSIGTDEEAFTFSEAAYIGDTAVTSQTALTTNGRVQTPNLYSDSIQTQGGSALTLAGTLSPTGVPTVTAGGPGTTAIGQRTVELTIFD